MPELQPRARPSATAASGSSSNSLQVQPQDNDRRGRGNFLRKKDHNRTGSSPGPIPQPVRPASQPVQFPAGSRPGKGAANANLGPQGYASPPFPRPASASPSTGPPSARSSFWGLGSSREQTPQVPPAPPPLIKARPQPPPSPNTPPFQMPGYYPTGNQPQPPPPPPPINSSGPLSSLLSGMMPHPPGQNPSSTQMAVTNAAQALENGAMDIYGRFRGTRR